MVGNPDAITTARLKQLCDLNVPYHGYVDDGLGTVVYINEMRIDEQTAENGGVLYYSKAITIKASEATHMVKKGDNLSVIADKLGVTVEQIARDNNIKNADLIHPGVVLKIKTDIQYSYTVNSSIDLSAFQSQEKGYQPLSETDIYKGLDYAISATSSLAASLEKNAGKSAIGNNGRFYWEKPSGRAFYGNQSVKTYGLSKIGRAAGRVAVPLAIVIEGVEVYDGFMIDGGTFNTIGHNTGKQIAGGIGAFSGAAAGIYLGGKIGFAIGVFFGGAGAIPGSIIGSFVGGLVGGWLGEKSAEYGYESLFNFETKEPEVMP